MLMKNKQNKYLLSEPASPLESFLNKASSKEKASVAVRYL